jgi:hypothetical protein
LEVQGDLLLGRGAISDHLSADAILCVPKNQITAVSQSAASLHGHIPGHLLHPRLIRVNRGPSDVHPAAL